MINVQHLVKLVCSVKKVVLRGHSQVVCVSICLCLSLSLPLSLFLTMSFNTHTGGGGRGEQRQAQWLTVGSYCCIILYISHNLSAHLLLPSSSDAHLDHFVKNGRKEGKIWKNVQIYSYHKGRSLALPVPRGSSLCERQYLYFYGERGFSLSAQKRPGEFTNQRMK